MHVVQRAGGSERQTNDRNHEQLTLLESLRHPGHSSAERSCPIHDAERATDQKNEEDHRSRGRHSLRNRDNRLKRSDRDLRNRVVRSGHDDLAPGDGIVAAVELSSGKQVAHHCGEGDESDQQCQRVGKAEFHRVDPSSCW